MKLKTVFMAALVSSNGLVNPGTELGDTGVDSRGGSGAGAASPGHDTNQIPDSVLLTDQRTTESPWESQSRVCNQNIYLHM